jgi:S1-C subfamily serine protease
MKDSTTPMNAIGPKGQPERPASAPGLRAMLALVGVALLLMAGLNAGIPTTQASAPALAPTSTPPRAGDQLGVAPAVRASSLPVQSVVQIWALQQDGGEWFQLWSGSGSIVTADGYILTNAHVVLPDKNYDVDGLLVSLTREADEPPEPSFLAEVVVADPDLDLAVIRVTADLDGNPIDYASLNLPAVPLGDSDSLELGTPISILGYPGIGGETITLTRGEVAGFVSEPGVKGHAFIKTSAAIAGGNSGGMAIDEDGYLIGVPTQLGYGGQGEFVDCRVLADTNGDGMVDDRDGCIPTGGFINALRPVNLSLSFIQEAVAGVVRQPTGSKSSQVEALPDAGQALFSDDFSDPESGWSTPGGPAHSVYYEKGQLVIDVNVENTLVWSVLEQEYADVDFQVETTRLGGPYDNAFGIMLRAQDVDNFYLVEISSDGFYRMGLFENDEWTSLVDWTKTDLIDPGGKNSMAAEAHADRITLFINGVQADQVYDDTFSSGLVGLVAHSLSEPYVSMGFDNVRLRVPGGLHKKTATPKGEAGGGEELIYSDAFGVESGDWYTGSDDEAIVGYADGGYFVQVIPHQFRVWSRLELDSDDVMIDVDARKLFGPDLNSFGVYCRYRDADNFYALEIGSDGTYAIHKVIRGEWQALVDWTETGDIRMGEAWNRLRVACVGEELSLWANDALLARASDGELPSGDMALAVSTFDEGNVRVHFDNLAIYAPAAADISGRPETLLADDFHDQSIWPVGEREGSRFYYADGEYLIEVFESEFGAWASSGDRWADTMIEVDARQVSGPDDNQYGLLCRYQDVDNYYEFDISGDGYYAIYLRRAGEFKALAPWTATNAIRQGESSNHLVVTCQGNRLAMSVNGDLVAEVFDDTFSEGEVAMIAGTFAEPGAVVAFDNLQVSAPAAPPVSPRAQEPAEAPTPTPYPTYTPYPTPQPTATPYPTYTPYPTPTAFVPPTQPRPTDTPTPTATSLPPYSVMLGHNVMYEPWGRPLDPDGCSGPYNDESPVRRLTVEIILTNNSNQFIPDRWGPTFFSAGGQVLETCAWLYDNMSVQPGETANVTFATHMEANDWVSAIVFDELGYTTTLCLNPAGQVVACP